jgi:predicted RNA-binding Zn-ribbon protein involved in translation (DUF1610 family)
MVGHIRNILQANGIACAIRGENRGIAAGEVPLTECWPELWIDDDTQGAESKQLIAEALAPGESDLVKWKCPHCGEEHEGQFTTCWNCGTNRPSDEI